MLPLSIKGRQRCTTHQLKISAYMTAKLCIVFEDPMCVKNGLSDYPWLPIVVERSTSDVVLLSITVTIAKIGYQRAQMHKGS